MLSHKQVPFAGAEYEADLRVYGHIEGELTCCCGSASSQQYRIATPGSIGRRQTLRLVAPITPGPVLVKSFFATLRMTSVLEELSASLSGLLESVYGSADRICGVLRSGPSVSVEDVFETHVTLPPNAVGSWDSQYLRIPGFWVPLPAPVIKFPMPDIELP